MKRFVVALLLCSLLFPVGTGAAEVFTYTPVKHATLVLQSGPATIYVDPVGVAEDFAGFPPPDLILITHIHKDHLDPQLVASLKKARTQVIGPASVIEQLGYGTTMNNGDVNTAVGVTIRALAAYNITTERLDFHPKGRDNSYLISKAGVRLYISGDTEDIPEMRNLRDIDIAFLCMNLPYTMTVEQAASAVKEFKPGLVIPYHFRGKEGMSDLDAFEQHVPGMKVSRLKWY